ncbi:uncharacterized protein LOC143295157 [Babylonia areolata]|uniref:uncharacterized protein LOC143295157 n=1 Tax=Babylonia areolata TaxID=304850 RepID=UPI003FCF990E
MAFTLLLMLMWPIAAVSSQNLFGSAFQGSPLGGNNPLHNPLGVAGGLNGLNGLNGMNGYSQAHPKRDICTVRMKGPDGSKLYATLTDDDEDDNLLSGMPSLFRGLPFARNPFQRSTGPKGVKIKGYFMNGAYKSGIAGANTLRGAVKIVVLEYGNTAGHCAGTGPGYVPRMYRARQTSPLGPMGPLGAFRPFGHPGGAFFGAGHSPFYQGNGQQNGHVAAASSPLHVGFQHATINSVIKGVSLKELEGRALGLCHDDGCNLRLPYCAPIVKDSMTIEEFSAKSHQTKVLQAAQQNQLGGGYPDIFDDGDDDDGDVFFGENNNPAAIAVGGNGGADPNGGGGIIF